MPNPASAFSLLDPLANAYSLPPMSQASSELQDVVPAERIPETSALQDQVIRQILSTLQEPMPKRTWKDRLTTFGAMTGAPTRPERDWQTRQEQASRSIQALNAMTGMERTDIGRDRNNIARDNLLARMIGIDQAGQRIDLNQKRFQWQQLGLKEQMDSEYDPRTNTNRNVIVAFGRNPQTGIVEVRDKVYLGQEPIHLGAYESAGGGMQMYPTTPTGGSGGLMGGPGFPSKQPPPGVGQSFADKNRFAGSLNGVLDLHRLGRESIASGMLGPFGKVGEVVSDVAAGSKYGRAFVGDPEVKFKQQMRWGVYQYVKAQTGAQFSITEMDRYESQFPTLADSPERASMMLQSAAAMIIRDINNMRAQWGGLRAPGYTPDMQAMDDTPPAEETGGPESSLDSEFDDYMRMRNAPNR